MAEYTYNENQIVQPGQSALLNDAIPCNHRPQYVIHRPGSGILTLRGIVNNPCACRARYRVAYDENIAPAAAEQFWNVNGFANIDVPAGCCYTVAVENASVSATPATTPASAIEIRNLNVEVSRVA